LRRIKSSIRTGRCLAVVQEHLVGEVGDDQALDVRKQPLEVIVHQVVEAARVDPRGEERCGCGKPAHGIIVTLRDRSRPSAAVGGRGSAF
jgi:hypothetical protein